MIRLAFFQASSDSALFASIFEFASNCQRCELSALMSWYQIPHDTCVQWSVNIFRDSPVVFSAHRRSSSPGWNRGPSHKPRPLSGPLTSELTSTFTGRQEETSRAGRDRNDTFYHLFSLSRGERQGPLQIKHQKRHSRNHALKKQPTVNWYLNTCGGRLWTSGFSLIYIKRHFNKFCWRAPHRS